MSARRGRNNRLARATMTPAKAARVRDLQAASEAATRFCVLAVKHDGTRVLFATYGTIRGRRSDGARVAIARAAG